jgi:hypothetical protein
VKKEGFFLGFIWKKIGAVNVRSALKKRSIYPDFLE